MWVQAHLTVKKIIFAPSSCRVFKRAGGVLLQICLVFLVSACSNEQEQEPVPVQTVSTLHQFIGSHSRLVWAQDVSDNKDVGAKGQHLRLLGYDSEDEKGERVILAGPDNFFRPLISPSGQQVIFSDFRQRKVYAVDWSGENFHFLTRGRALAVLQDPDEGIEWIYVGREASSDMEGPGSQKLYRVQLGNPGIEELVWDKAPFGEAVHVSGDGRHFSAEAARAACVLVDIEKQTAQRQGKGCWPAVAPDQSQRFWFFDGAHRNLEMVDTHQGTRNRIYLANAPGIDGHEVYHPRWSNHPRYMVMTGPYVIRQGGNNIRGGGGAVEIYVGRFNEDYSDMEAWFQVSSNERADFFPDLWIAGGKKSNFEKKLIEKPSNQEAIALQTSSWPIVNENLLFAWMNVAADNKWISPAGKVYQAEIITEGMARFGLNYQMRLDSGWYLANRSPQPEPSEYSDSKSIFLEFVISLPVKQKHSNGYVLALGVEQGNQSILRIEQHVLILEERRKGQEVESIRLGQLSPGQSHIMLDISPSKVIFSVNNGDAKTYKRTNSEIISWPIIMGDFGSQKQSGWDGLLERVALYTRALSKQEMEETAQLFVHEQQTNVALQPIIVKAELVSVSSIPTPEDILPYRRGLVVNEYRIVELIQGKMQDKEILVAQWAILNGKRLPEATSRIVGEVYDLHLDAFENRPELEGERLSMESDNLLLTMYYDLGP